MNIKDIKHDSMSIMFAIAMMTLVVMTVALCWITIATIFEALDTRGRDGSTRMTYHVLDGKRVACYQSSGPGMSMTCKIEK